MFTYEYYCEAFPVRNQVCDFWEVLVTQGLAVGKKWWCFVPELSWVFADMQKFSLIAQRSFLYPTYFGNPSQAGEAPSPQSELKAVLPVGSSSGLVAITECESSVLPSQAPLGFRETWARGRPDPCACWF